MKADIRTLQTVASYLIAGVVASLAGLLVFLLIHHFWIRPIWFVAAPGLLAAALGGLAVGWSFYEIHAGLPAPPWTSIAIFCLFSLVLAPSAVMAELRPALLGSSNSFSIPPGQGAAIAVRFLLELVLSAALVGAACGWYLGRTPQATLATAVAGIALAAGPGHNIPFLGNTPAAVKGLLLLAAAMLVSAVVLVAALELLSPR